VPSAGADAPQPCPNPPQEPEKKKPLVVKYGLNHITSLVESGKAQLVVIAHDVDPIELVVWLPQLCKSMGVPYCIVKVRAGRGGAGRGTAGPIKGASTAAAAFRRSGQRHAPRAARCAPAPTHTHIHLRPLLPQGKARLGAIVHKKTAAALAVTGVKPEDQREFGKIVESVKAQFNEGARVNWGGGIMGVKSQHKTRARERILAKELAQRLK
jgi:large subunit ribosomal protein L7Ae